MIWIELICDQCNEHGTGSGFHVGAKYLHRLRRTVRKRGWALVGGKDLCPVCLERKNAETQKGGNMKDPKAWRRAVLNRAVEKDTTPETVLAEFFPHINDPPRTIEPSEAQELASRYPFDAEEITEAFTRPGP